MEIKVIKDLVEKTTNIDINTKRRQREIVEARALYYKLCREHTFQSLSEIGKSVERDHATVLWGIQNFESWSKQNISLKSAYLNLKTKIQALMDEEDGANKETQDFMDKYLRVREENCKLMEINKDLSEQLDKVKTELKKRNKYFERNGFVVR